MIAREKSLHYIPKLLPIPVGRREMKVYFIDVGSGRDQYRYEIETAKLMTRFGYDVLIDKGGCWWRGCYWRIEKLQGGICEELIKRGKMILDVRWSEWTATEVVREVLRLVGEGIEFEEIYVLDGKFYCAISGEIARKNLHGGKDSCYNRRVIK